MSENPNKPRWTTREDDLRRAFVRQMRKTETDPKGLAERMGRPAERLAMDRWLRGENNPSLSKFLGWLAAMNGQVSLGFRRPPPASPPPSAPTEPTGRGSTPGSAASRTS